MHTTCPRIDESLDALAGSRYFITLDLIIKYWKVFLDQDAQKKSAFANKSGLWKWRVLPFWPDVSSSHSPVTDGAGTAGHALAEFTLAPGGYY